MARDLREVQNDIDRAKAKQARCKLEAEEFLSRSEDEWTDGEVERLERLNRGHDAAEADLKRLRDEQRDIIRGVASHSSNLESGETGGGARSAELMRRVDPWDEQSSDVISRARAAGDKIEGLPDEGRERVHRLVDDEQGPAAQAILALGSPHYMTAFRSMIRDPQHGHRMWSDRELAAYKQVQITRTALSLSDQNGGFLVPLTLDSSIVLTNAGVAGSIRSVATIKLTATDTWSGVTSSGVSAEWTAEAAVMADATPTFAQPTITPRKADAWILGSYEVLGDSNFASQLGKLIGDARTRLEEVAFVTGVAASNQPVGVLTAVGAITASRVTATTGGVFSAATDIYKVDNAVPPRAEGNVRWMAAKGTINSMRQFPKFGTAVESIVDDSGPRPRMLGHEILESSAMTSTAATGNNILFAGNFLDYYIVDRLGVTMIYNNMIMDQATGRPTGQSGWVSYWRTGADCINTDSFRLLRL